MGGVRRLKEKILFLGIDKCGKLGFIYVGGFKSYDFFDFLKFVYILSL